MNRSHENNSYDGGGSRENRRNFYTSFESADEEMDKKCKPSKIAELNFMRKYRNMRKKLKYLTEAEESEDDYNRFQKRFSSQIDSSDRLSHYSIKKRLSPCGQKSSGQQDQTRNTEGRQVYRKLLKVNEDCKQDQEQREGSSGQNIDAENVESHFSEQRSEQTPRIASSAVQYREQGSCNSVLASCSAECNSEIS